MRCPGNMFQTMAIDSFAVCAVANPEEKNADHLVVPPSAYRVLPIQKMSGSRGSSGTCGYDEISNRIIKLTAPLTYICNAVLSTGVFPDRLKYAVDKPIFKKGNKQEISNYRPISILTSFSKIIEKLIYARLHTHIDMNNILVQGQHGFRTHSSTEQAAFTSINSILTG